MFILKWFNAEQNTFGLQRIGCVCMMHLEGTAATPARHLSGGWLILVPVLWLLKHWQLWGVINPATFLNNLWCMDFLQFLGWQQFLGGSLLLLCLFWVTVEEQVDNDVPVLLAGDNTAQTQNFTRQQPPHQTD